MDQTQIPLASRPGEVPSAEHNLLRYEPQTEEGRYLKAIYLSTEKTRRTQAAQTWLLLFLVAFLGIFVTGSVVLANRFVPTVTDLADELQSLSTQTSELVQSISDADFEGLVNSTKEFVDSSSDSAAEAIAKINSIDIQSLNQSIEALAAIVTPLARLLGR